MVRIPTESECLELLSKHNVPSGVINHSIAVKNFALQTADLMETQGKQVNRELITAATLLHDIMKVEAEVCHGIEGGEFLRNLGFHDVANIVEKHCLSNLKHAEFVPKTTEEKLLLYSDLKINGGRVVSLEERFDYIHKVYKPQNIEKFAELLVYAKELEKELVGEKE